jgi:hypothetical protein
MKNSDPSVKEILDKMLTLINDALFRETKLLESALDSSSMPEPQKKEMSASLSVSAGLVRELRSDIASLRGP